MFFDIKINVRENVKEFFKYKKGCSSMRRRIDIIRVQLNGWSENVTNVIDKEPCARRA